MTKPLNTLPAWINLEEQSATAQNQNILSLFQADQQRFEKMSFKLGGLFVDFSKNNISASTLSSLLQLAEESGLRDKRDAFFNGDKINTTENRAVQHMALRSAINDTITIEGQNVVPDVHATLDRMATFAENLRQGQWLGHTGKAITDIVNIGIGGSSLGPQLVTEALGAFHHPRLTCHFVANVEASDLTQVLKRVSAETTLFIIASKTFTTAETMQNARLAREWLVEHYKGDTTAVSRHFVAASTNQDAVSTFGIAADNMFPFSDWVGGRYSVWSAIGLSVMLMIGADNFKSFLSGARAMDQHFKTAPFAENLPVLMALMGIWYRNFMNYPAYAVIPYHAALKRLPAFLQQLDMESNGKSVTKTSLPPHYATGPMIFGEPGTDAQHSFFQWLHQSPDIVPVDFIAAIKTPYGNADQQKMLLANMLAQSEALMIGKDGGSEPHRNFSGNRPTTTILLDELTPETAGMLLALYEHKVFVQGAIWDINSFDQWGVELGKVLATAIEQDLNANAPAAHDASTLGLISRIKSMIK